MLALQTIIEYGAEDEVVRAKASIQAQFSLDLDDKEERAISEDENSVPEDSWVRLKRKQQENQLLIQPRRRQKRDLNAPLLDTTRSTAKAGPSTRSAPTSARVQLPNGRDHGSEGMDHSGTVSTASQRLINRRKRRRLDEPLARNLNAPVAIFNAFVPADLAPVSMSSEHDTDMSEMWDPMVVDRTSQQLVRRRKRRRLDDPPVEIVHPDDGAALARFREDWYREIEGTPVRTSDEHEQRRKRARLDVEVE
ncbi:hypothetical protein B0H13DRAFT_2326840 [Mycena leptocephala]|nr:hypothetical protein B0H13DRAFT_2326840 [Mycena leptocephala]